MALTWDIKFMPTKDQAPFGGNNYSAIYAHYQIGNMQDILQVMLGGRLQIL